MTQVRGELRRESIVMFVRHFSRARGYPPSLHEIAEAVGLSSAATVHAHLRDLAAQGRIEWEPRQPRTVRVIEEEEAS